MTLRDFLYLDRPLVRDFLAQAEHGLVDEATERATNTGKGGVAGRVGSAGTGVSAQKSKERSLETEAVVRQVGPSEFDRLYRYLESDDLVIFEEVSEKSVADQIRRQQFLEVDARIRVSGLQQFASVFKSYADAVQMMKQISPQFDLNTDEANQVAALSSVIQEDKVMHVIASVPGDAGFNVGLDLDPAHTLVDTWDTDASVLLKVQRVVRGDDVVMVGSPLGGLLKLIPEEDRHTIVEALSSPDAQSLGISGGMEIRSPGVIGTPIAIYR